MHEASFLKGSLSLECLFKENISPLKLPSSSKRVRREQAKSVLCALCGRALQLASQFYFSDQPIRMKQSERITLPIETLKNSVLHYRSVS